MSERRFRPKLNKKLIGTRDGYRVYSANAMAIHNEGETDQEFTNYAIHADFPDLVPGGEVWIARELVRREGEFFAAAAVARLKELDKGGDSARAYAAGLNAQRRLRRAASGVAYRAGRPHRHIPQRLHARRYAALPDGWGEVTVRVVDGYWVRNFYKTDFAEGGHGYVYRWVPKPEIWLEKDLHAEELPLILAHEFIERRLMRDEGLGYDRAHRISSEVEFDLRRPETRRQYPGLTCRRLGKADLKAIATEEFYQYVRRHQLLGLVRRAGPMIAEAVGA